MKPSKDRVNELRKGYADSAVSGFQRAIDASRRVEAHTVGRTETVQLRSAMGMPNHGKQTISTQGITFDQLWDICGRMITYQSRSSGRYATNATKGLQQAKGTPDKFGRKERSHTKVAVACDKLTHTRELLGKMCSNLVQCESAPMREQLIRDITAKCEREGIRGLPYFMKHPHELQTKQEAEAYIATLYAMFPMCGRGMKKYYLSPRIKQARKLWDIEKPSQPETIETIMLRYEKLLLG